MTLGELKMNIDKNEVKNIRVFSRKVAIELRQKGHNIVKTEPNFNKPQFDVYYFEDTPQLRKDFADEIKVVKWRTNKYEDKETQA